MIKNLKSIPSHPTTPDGTKVNSTERKSDVGILQYKAKESLPNTLDAWKPLFLKKNISLELLNSCFGPGKKQPNYEHLMNNVEKIQKLQKPILGYKKNELFKQPWQLICLCEDDIVIPFLEEGREALINLKDEKGYSLFTYLSCANTPVFKFFVETVFDLSEERMKVLGSMLLYDALASGSLESAKFIFEKMPEATNKFEKMNERQCLRAATLSGNKDVIEYLLQIAPDIKNETIYSEVQLLHLAAGSGSKEAIEYVYSLAPSLINTKIQADFTVLHQVALSGSKEATVYVMQIAPQLKSLKTTPLEETFELFAALSGSSEILEIFEKYTPPRNKFGETVLHYAIRSGSIESAKILYDKFKDWGHIYLKSFDDTNMLHFAAKSGSIEMFQFMYHLEPQLLKYSNKNGVNILHFAAQGNHVELFKYILKMDPYLLKELWCTDSNGASVEFYGQNMNPGPRAILRASYDEAVEHLYEYKDKDNCTWANKLLDSFFDDFYTYISMKKNIELDKLEKLNSELFLKKTERARFNGLVQAMRIKIIPLKTQPLTLSVLKDLILFSEYADICNKEVDKPSAFLKKLKNFEENVKSLGENLNPDAYVTLSILIDDMIRESHGSRALVDQFLIEALVSSLSLAHLFSSNNSMEAKFGPENYESHLNTMLKSFTECEGALSPDTVQIMNSTVLPGLNHLRTNENDIMEHMQTKFGVLYYLANNMPLHTDHVPSKDGEEFRKLLHSFMNDILGAFYLAKSSGNLSGFFDRMSKGMCLEGRAAETLLWATSLTETKQFVDVMNETLEKYKSYSKTMTSKLKKGTEREKMDALESMFESSEFILKRYAGFSCVVHADYAPEGKMTRKGVLKFLREVLDYSDASLIIETKKQFFKQLNAQLKAETSIAAMWNKSPSQLALNDLLIAIKKSEEGTPLNEVIEKWEISMNSSDKLKTNLDLINEENAGVKILNFSWTKGNPFAAEGELKTATPLLFQWLKWDED